MKKIIEKLTQIMLVANSSEVIFLLEVISHNSSKENANARNIKV